MFMFYTQNSTARAMIHARLVGFIWVPIVDTQARTRESEEFLEDLAEELSVPPSWYEEAQR
jgi:hypothetical protein